MAVGGGGCNVTGAVRALTARAFHQHGCPLQLACNAGTNMRSTEDAWLPCLDLPCPPHTMSPKALPHHGDCACIITFRQL